MVQYLHFRILEISHWWNIWPSEWWLSCVWTSRISMEKSTHQSREFSAKVAGFNFRTCFSDELNRDRKIIAGFNFWCTTMGIYRWLSLQITEIGGYYHGCFQSITEIYRWCRKVGISSMTRGLYEPIFSCMFALVHPPEMRLICFIFNGCQKQIQILNGS